MQISKPIQILLIIVVTAIANALILLNINIPVVRPLLAVFLILAVGHTTLLAWANHLALRGIVRVLMTIMLGITLVVISGFILNYTPWGIDARTWTFILSAIILFNCVLALIRRDTVVSEVPSTSVQSWKLELKVPQIVLLVLAVVVAGASIAVARNGALSQPATTYSQLWMVPNADTNATQAVLGVKNEEGQSLTYHLVILQGSNIVHDFPIFSLAPNETWQGKLDLQTVTAKDAPIQAVLYRDNDQTQPYRTATLWLQ